MFSDYKGSIQAAPSVPPLPPYPGTSSSPEQAPAPVPDTPASEPPPYPRTAVPQQTTPIVPPATLILSGDTIRSGSASSTPLYHLSRTLPDLRHFHTSIHLSRIDHRPRSTGGSPVPTKRHIYNLARPPPITVTTFAYYLEPTSREAIDVGLQPYARFRSAGYYAFRRADGTSGDVEGVLFTAKARGEGMFDWREGGEEGRVLGYETFGRGFWRLQVVEGMERWRRDVLVAVWCLRLWCGVMDGDPRPACKLCWRDGLVAGMFGLLTWCVF